MTFTAGTVAEAAAKLDALRPGWHDEIDVDRLDMNSMSDCVLGQLYGSHIRGMQSIGLADHCLPTTSFFGSYRNRWVMEINRRSSTLSKSAVRDAILSADLYADETVDALLAKLGLEPRVVLPTGKYALVEDIDGMAWVRQSESFWRELHDGEHEPVTTLREHLLSPRVRRVIFPGE